MEMFWFTFSSILLVFVEVRIFHSNINYAFIADKTNSAQQTLVENIIVKLKQIKKCKPHRCLNLILIADGGEINPSFQIHPII